MFDLRLDGEAARLTLNRPEARNAIPAARWAELADVAKEVVASEARVLVIEGAGTAFCAGADISDFATMSGDTEAVATFRQRMREGIEALASVPIPTIAAIGGPCFGAGVALALACDLRVAAPAASFAITPAKFGISYPQEDVHRLTSLVGPGQASRLLLTALPIDAREAHRIGLVEILGEDLDALVTALLSGASESHATLKEAIRLSVRGVRSDDAQDRAFDALIASEALQTRLAALRRKG